MYAYVTEIWLSGIKVTWQYEYIIFSNIVSWDSITPTYLFRFECHIVLSDFFTPSYLLSANEAGHDGTLHDRFTEMHDDIKLLILL